MREKTISFTMQGKKQSFDAVITISAFSLTELLDLRMQFLHPDEVPFFNSCIVPKRLFSFLQGRYAAKKAVSVYLNTPFLKDIIIGQGIFFQPVVLSAFSQNSCVSLSHSGQWAIAVVFPEVLLVGVDIEWIDMSRNWVGILPLSFKEQELISKIESDHSIVFWCGKEALSKALKIGFTADTHIFEMKSVEEQNGYYECKFRFFPNFKACVWLSQGYCIALAFPENIEVDIILLKTELRDVF